MAILALALPVLPAAKAATYTEDATIELTGQTYVTVWGLSAGDTDRDGRNEVVADYDWYNGGGTPRLVFYEWNGTAYALEAAIPRVSLAKPNSLDPPRRITIADADGDGDADVTFVGAVDGVGGLYVYSWNGTAYAEVGSVSGTFMDSTVGDANLDGVPEIFALSSGTVAVYEWRPGGFAAARSWSVGAVSTFVQVANADWDPRPEVVVASGDLDVRTFRWDGADYVPEGAGSVGFGFSARGMGVGDADADGRPEVVRMDYHRNIVVYGWTGAGYGVEWTGVSTPDSQDDIHNGIVGDADRDGFPEILVGHGNHVGANSLYVYRRDPAGGFTADWNSGWLPGYVRALAVGDADNDGTNEILTGSGSQSRIRVFSPVLSGDRPPTAIALADPTDADTGETIAFDGTGSRDDFGIVSFAWDFGDGATTEGPLPWHAYGAPGTFAVTLTVRDAANQTGTDRLWIRVQDPSVVEGVVPWWLALLLVVGAVGAGVAVLALRRRRRRAAGDGLPREPKGWEP